jgi:hypothetical protein
MNILQKILGTIFPPYKYSVERKEGEKLYHALVNAFPEKYIDLKEQLYIIRFFSMNNWTLYPQFKFLTHFYRGESRKKLQKRGVNLKLSGIKIFSKERNTYLELELLIRNNLPIGIRIGNNDFKLDEFDLKRIDTSNILESSFQFEPDEVEKMYSKLPNLLKASIEPNSLEEIELNGRTYFSIYDLEDGNCIAIDKNLNVYSLVHDATPMSKKMKIGLDEFLNQVKTNSFDVDKHLNERCK